MNTRYIKYFGIILLTYAGNLLAQSWPILQIDDPTNYYIYNCAIGEIHDTGQDHFHEGIDIDCNNNGVNIRPIDNGTVITAQSDYVEIGHDFNGEYYLRISIYRHLTNINVNNNQIVVISNTILGQAGNHLHVEMKVWDDSQYMIVSPFDNNTGWQLTLPPGHVDTYPPQINDILIETLNNQNNNVSSGFDVIDPSSNNGAVTFHADYLKAHINSTTPHSTLSTGTEYSFPTEKIVVWGNIGFVVNARDVGINTQPGPNTHSGQGLTVANIGYSYIDQNNNYIEKYIIDFSDFLHTERYELDEVFHTPYFDPEQMPNLFLNGNHDFIELFSPDDTYLHIHREINNIQSNGIWFTKADESTNHVFNQTPDQAQVADANEFALYSDGQQTLNFFVSDAAGQEVDEDLHVIVDNFRPFIQKVEITQVWQLGTIPINMTIYSSEWEWTPGPSGGLVQYITENKAAKVNSPTTVIITSSEPLQHCN